VARKNIRHYLDSSNDDETSSTATPAKNGCKTNRRRFPRSFGVQYGPLSAPPLPTNVENGEYKCDVSSAPYSFDETSLCHLFKIGF